MHKKWHKPVYPHLSFFFLTLLALVSFLTLFFSVRIHQQLFSSEDKVLATTVVSNYYVSPSGSPAGNGSLANPWDLKTALSQPAAVKPGDMLWVRGGTYQGAFTSKLTGTQEAPITVRNYQNERVIIDLNTGEQHKPRGFEIKGGGYTNYWGLEFTDSHPKRSTTYTGSDPKDLPREGGSVGIWAPHIKLINSVVHDLGTGIGFWVNSVDSELYGTLIYNNGWDAPDRGHGHGIYTQNLDGTKTIKDVISFNNFATGAKAYGVTGESTGYVWDGYVAFNNGAPQAIFSNDLTHREWNLLIGSDEKTSDRITVTNSLFYFGPGTDKENAHIGYTPSPNGHVDITNNYVVGGFTPMSVNNFTSGRITDNFFYQRGEFNKLGRLLMVKPPTGTQPSAYVIDKNTYYDNTNKSGGIYVPFTFLGITNKFGTSQLTLSDWNDKAGFDKNSSYQRGNPTGVKVFVRPNRYEPGRANIIVYNFDKQASIGVDLASAGLSQGQEYEIHDAQDLFGEPVAKGIYTGQQVQLPMNLIKVSPLVGAENKTPQHTSAEFGVFVVTVKSPEPTPTAMPTETPTPTPTQIPLPTLPPVAESQTTAPTSFSLEAEGADIVAPMQIYDDPTASGGKYVMTPVGDQGSMTFTVDIKVEGNYLILGKVKAPTSKEDSFVVSVDGGATDIYDVAEKLWSPLWQYTQVNGRAGTGTPLKVNPRVFYLTPGTHTILFKARDFHTQLDNIVVVKQ